MNLRIGSRITQSKAVAAINDPVPEFGGLWIDDTNLHVPPDTTGPNQYGWAQVQVITATVFDAATLVNIAGIATKTVPAGTLLRGIFTAIKLTSGSVIAYNATETPN